MDLITLMKELEKIHRDYGNTKVYIHKNILYLGEVKLSIGSETITKDKNEK